MYCRSCGTLLDDKAEICVKCGCRSENGIDYCPKCGAKTKEKQAICEACGYGLDIKSFFDSVDIDFSTPLDGRTLSHYYQKEFQKIHNSKGAYKGKFNVCAFLFGPIWALTKIDFWLEGLIALIVCFLTAGIGCIAAAFYFGFRGNYRYYESHVLRKKIRAWDEVTSSKN